MNFVAGSDYQSG